jgi:hypothetical protein
MWWALFEGPSKLRARLERTERRAVAKNRPRHQVPLLPEAPSGDELMRPVAPAQKPSHRWLPWTLGGLAATTAVAIGAALVFWMSEPEPPTAASSPPIPTAGVSEARLPTLASAAAERPSFSIAWRGEVTASRGSTVEVGSNCSIEVKVVGGDVDWLKVVCSDAVLYDRRTALQGESISSSELFELPKGDDAWIYRLEYVDTGARTGRSQITLNSFTHTGVVHSDSGQRFRAELALTPDSEARRGPSLFETPRSVAPAEARLRATEVTGPSPIPLDTECRFASRFVMSSKNGHECKAELECRGSVVYGAGESGYGHCTLDGHRVAAFDDDKESFRDSDPAVRFDGKKSELRLRDSPGGQAWTAKLSVVR